MKKRTTIIVISIISVLSLLLCILIFTGICYKKNADFYILSRSDIMSPAIITFNGQKYTTDHLGVWTEVKLNERVGYISGHQNNNLVLFYSHFEHGLYTLQDDPEHNFLKVRQKFADKQYILFVKEGYMFPSPDTINFDYFTLSYPDVGNRITDRYMMELLLSQYVNPSDEQIFTYEQMSFWNISFHLEFYTSEYPSLCFNMTIYYSDANKAFYLQGDGNRYIRLTDDCAARFIQCLCTDK